MACPDVPLPLQASPSRPLAARQRRAALLMATALTGSFVLISPVLAYSFVTNTNGDTSAGSLGAAAQTYETFIGFQNLGAAAVINLAAPTHFTDTSTYWYYWGSTTSLTVGGNDIVVNNGLEINLGAGEDLTFNSKLISPTSQIVSRNGTTTFNGDISEVYGLDLEDGATAFVGTTTSAGYIEIDGNSTLRFNMAGTSTSSIYIEETATIDTGAHNVTLSGVISNLAPTLW